MPEAMETRLARLEEAMVSVKGDTLYIRKGLDSFKEKHWMELTRTTAKIAGLSTIVSMIMATATVLIVHMIEGS